MQRFLASLTVSFIFLVIQGCKKDAVVVPIDELGDFVKSSGFVVRGNVGDSSILWGYGIGTFQRANSINITGDSAHRLNSLYFRLTSDKDYKTGFYVSTPFAPKDDLFSKTVALGDKAVGKEGDNFFLQLTFTNSVYNTNGDQSGSEFKILKVLKTKDAGLDMVQVWFTANCKFYDATGKYAFDFKDARFIAGFLYNL